MLNPLQNLERAIQQVMDCRHEIRIAQAALNAAVHAEQQAHHELRKARDDYKLGSPPTLGVALGMPDAIVTRQSTDAVRTPQPYDTTFPGQPFDRVRD